MTGESVVSPSPFGRNCVSAALAPPRISRVEAAIVPADGLELAISTRTDPPPATGCSSANWNEESRLTAYSAILVGALPGVVRNLGAFNGPTIAMADGVRVTVAVAVRKPAAEAV